MRKPKEDGGKTTPLKSLGDILEMNLTTLEQVRDGKINHKKAALLFTGTRTAVGVLKLGIEASKMGLSMVGGLNVNDKNRLIGDKNAKDN